MRWRYSNLPPLRIFGVREFILVFVVKVSLPIEQSSLTIDEKIHHRHSHKYSILHLIKHFASRVIEHKI